MMWSKEEGKDQKLIQSSTTNWPGTPYGKLTKKHKKHHTQRGQEVVPFPGGDHRAAMSKQDRIKKTTTTNITKRIHKRSLSCNLHTICNYSTKKNHTLKKCMGSTSYKPYKSKWVWSGNITSTQQTNLRLREEEPYNTDCPKTLGRQLSKASSSVFPIKMITKLEGHKVLNKNHNKGQTQHPNKQWE